MTNLLIVVDMQNDFIDGALGTKEAQLIVPNICKKIADFNGTVIFTADTHTPQYLNTQEGHNLPIEHCIKPKAGWQLHPEIAVLCSKLNSKLVEKETFGAKNLPSVIEDICGTAPESIELCGLCTDICVIANAMLLKAFFPEVPIKVDASCCAGVTPQSHQNALSAMRTCQIEIINDAL